MKTVKKKLHLQFLVFIISSTQTSLHVHTRQSERCASNVVPKLSALRSDACHARCCWQSEATARQSVLNTHTQQKKKKEKKKKKQRKRFSSSWQKVEADTFPRASWQRKPLFVSPPFCYSFEDESVLFPLPPASVLFFAFLISKWAARQLGQNCFRDGGRGGGERGDGRRWRWRWSEGRGKQERRVERMWLERRRRRRRR